MRPPLDPEQATDQSLLTAFAALTHRMHAARASKSDDSDQLALSLRTQRDLLEEEILHRMSNGHRRQGAAVMGMTPRQLIEALSQFYEDVMDTEILIEDEYGVSQRRSRFIARDQASAQDTVAVVGALGYSALFLLMSLLTRRPVRVGLIVIAASVASSNRMTCSTMTGGSSSVGGWNVVMSTPW